MAPLEWPGKVLSNLAGASGAQPGCCWFPESISIWLNAWMHRWVPALCWMLASVWNYVCVWICVYVPMCVWIFLCVCLCYTQRNMPACLTDRFGCYYSWQEVFSFLFLCLAVKSVGKYPFLSFGQNRHAMNFQARDLMRNVCGAMLMPKFWKYSPLEIVMWLTRTYQCCNLMPMVGHTEKQ